MMGYTDGKVLPSLERFQALIAQARRERAVAAGRGPALSLLPGAPARRAARSVRVQARTGGRLAGGVEVRRHPRPDREALRQGVGLVARRGTGDRTLSRDRGAGAPLPDGTVLDGEIMVWQDEPADPPGTADGRPAPFSLLQQRIGRKTLTKKVLAEAPVTFMAYDLLEQDGQDIRGLPQRERRVRLEELLAGTGFKVSPIESHPTWLEFAAAARAVARTRRRRLHAQAPGRGLWHRAHQGRRPVVEMEDRADDDRLRAGVRAGRPRPPRVGLHRLHLRRLEPRRRGTRQEADAVLEAIEKREPPQPDALQLVRSPRPIRA